MPLKPDRSVIRPPYPSAGPVTQHRSAAHRGLVDSDFPPWQLTPLTLSRQTSLIDHCVHVRRDQGVSPDSPLPAAWPRENFLYCLKACLRHARAPRALRSMGTPALHSLRSLRAPPPAAHAGALSPRAGGVGTPTFVNRGLHEESESVSDPAHRPDRTSLHDAAQGQELRVATR